MNMPILLLFFFATVGRLVWSQYLYCPAQDWTLGSTITLKCYLPRKDIPSKCTGVFNDRVTFRRRPFTGSSSRGCTVSDVSTSSCTPSSSECGCQPANATYVMVHHTFTVDAEDDGTWECSLTCLNGNFQSQLKFTSDNCDNRVVMAHAVLSTPTITVTTPDTGSGWTVGGSVDITEIFSSTGDYSCMWSYRRDSGQYTDISSSTVTIDPSVNGTSVRTGQCHFPNRSLTSASGTYTYRVTVSPGQTVKTDSSVIIETPVISNISCYPGTGDVAESRELTCTCNANVGQPAGRLRWSMESTTGTTAIEDGQYGDGTLAVRLTVDRAHHVNKLRCDVDWIADVMGPEVTLQGTSETELLANNEVSVTVNEKEAVTLVCQSRGRPTPRLELLQRGQELAREDGGQLSLSKEMSRLSHSFTARCNNTGTFTCRADNGVGTEQQASVQLTVHCKPRSTSAGPVVPRVNFIDRLVTVAFSLEAFPLPDRHRFQFLGNTLSSNNSQPPPDGIVLGAWCTNTYSVYAVLCYVSVDRVDDSAGGFYTYTAGNEIGEESLVFQVVVKAEDGSSHIVAALGVPLAVLIVIVVMLWMWRRHWILPCTGEGQGQASEDASRSSRRRYQSRGGPSPVAAAASPVLSDDYELTEQGLPRSQPPSVYTSLQTSDIGVSSMYTDISPNRTEGTAVHESPIYENSGTMSTPLKVNLSAPGGHPQPVV